MELDMVKERVAFKVWADSKGLLPHARAGRFEGWLAAKRHAAQVAEPANFCDRCGKRNIGIHTCTPPADVPAIPGIEPAPSGASDVQKVHAAIKEFDSGASVDINKDNMLVHLMQLWEFAQNGAKAQAAYDAIIAHIDAWNASQMTARTAEVAQNAAALMKKMRPATVADMQSVDSVARDAARYRWLRDRMRFSSSQKEAPTMTLSSSIAAPEHNPHADWVGGRFEASVDRAIDAAMSPTKAGEGM